MIQLTFRVLNNEARQKWESILGVPVEGDTVSISYETYQLNADHIREIQGQKNERQAIKTTRHRSDKKHRH